MIEILKIENENDFKHADRNSFIAFLHHHLGKFGDPIKDINHCLNYAFSNNDSAGGYALTAIIDQQLVGGVIMNKTGMGGYIPEWVLVYIAVDEKHRGKGIGKTLIQEVYKLCKGDIKLHVEYDNPAKRLYERLGFKNKYAEMRFTND